jgi:hypothetical protein
MLKNLNTSNTQSLVQYRQKQYLPQWSRHSVTRQKIRAASAGDFILSFCFDWFIEVAT